MAVTSHVYPLALRSILDKTIDLHADTFKALLMTGDASAWTATQQAFQWVSDVIAAYTEVTSGGYARVTLAAPAVTASGAAVKWTVTSPISWGSSITLAARSMLVFDSSIGAGVDSATPAITIIDFGTTVSSTAATWAYTVDPTNGLATVTAS